jgi:probable HAF family extracellular repeat protein
MCFSHIQRLWTAARAAGVLMLGLVVPASAQDRFKIISLPTPAGYNSSALGLNDNGNVVGYNVQGDTYQAFLYSQSSGSSIDIGSLGGQTNAACAINGSDQVAGYSQDANGNLGAFIYTKDSGIKAVGSLDGGVSSEAFGINNSGQAVGDSQNATDDHRPVLFGNSGVKDLNVCVAQNSNAFRTAYAINDAGQVAGRTDTDQGAIHAFVVGSANGDLKDIGTLGGTNSEALAINKSGEVAGDAETANGTPHAFLYRKGSTRDLGTLAGLDTASFARSINDEGEVVGDSESADQKRAFVYRNGQMSELDKLATNLAGSGFASLDVAYGINNRGWIAGYGTTPDGRTIAFLAVPEGQGATPLAEAQPQAPQPEAQSEGGGDDYSVFYSRLSSDGDWVEAGDYGYCFKPHVAEGEWAPYRDGHWVWTDRGWFWYSNENFGWATYHYGRWVRISGQGWCWVPGNEWAPAWVSWRQSSEYCGWAPLPPDAGFSVNAGIGGWADSYYGIGPAAYTFINFKAWGQSSYLRYTASPAENVQIIRQTTNITNIRVQNTVINNFGPRVETLQQYTNQPIVPTKIVFDSNRQAGYGASIRGSELQVVAPAEKLRAVSTVQPQVKTRLAKAEVDNGWKNVDPAEQAELRRKFAEQNPPPKEPLPKQALVKPTFIHETKNLNPPPGTGPQHPQVTGQRAVPPGQTGPGAQTGRPADTGRAAETARRTEPGGGKGWNTMPPNLIGSQPAGGDHFQKTLPNRRAPNGAVTPRNEEQRLPGRQPAATPVGAGQLERKETPAPAEGVRTPKNEEQRPEKVGQNPPPGNEVGIGKQTTPGAEERTKGERAPKGAATPKVEPPKPEEASKSEASPKAAESIRKAEGAPKPEGSPRNESIRREEGGPKPENPPKEEPKGESLKKEEGAPKVANPSKEEHSPKSEPAAKREEAAPNANPQKEERPPKNEPAKKDEAAPKENKPKEEGQPKGEPVKKEEGGQKPENRENRAPAPQGQKPEPEKEKGKGKEKEKGSPAP